MMDHGLWLALLLLAEAQPAAPRATPTQAIEAATIKIERLDGAHQPLVDDFRAADGRVRFVTVLSPT